MLWIVLAMIGSFAVGAYVLKAEAAEKQSRPVPFSAIPPKQAYELIKKNQDNPDFIILDVRTPEEFSAGHIKNAVNINYNAETFVYELDKLDKTKTYLVYCRTGRRSADTLTIMKKLNFKDVYRILGDINRWKSEKLPVIR